MTSAARSVAPSSEIVLSSSFPMRACGCLLPQTATGNFYTAAARQNVAPPYQPLMAALPLPDGPLNSDGLTAPLTVGYSDPTSLDAYSIAYRPHHQSAPESVWPLQSCPLHGISTQLVRRPEASLTIPTPPLVGAT